MKNSDFTKLVLIVSLFIVFAIINYNQNPNFIIDAYNRIVNNPMELLPFIVLAIIHIPEEGYSRIR